MATQKDDRTSMSSESSHYTSARDELTESLDQSSKQGMADSSSDYTFVSNMDDLSLDTSMLEDSKTMSTSSLLDSTLNHSEIFLISSDDSEGPHGHDDLSLSSPDSDTLLDHSNTLQNVTVQSTSTPSEKQNNPSKSAELLNTSSTSTIKPKSSTEALLKSPVKMVNGQLEVQMFATRDEFEANLPETVSVLDGPFGSRVYLIGSAHFSEESMNDVSFVIRNVRPDFVMVELCQSRSHILLMDEAQLMHEATDLNLAKIREIYRTNGLNSIFYILLLSMSSKLTKDLGRAPGCEFRRALQEARMIPRCTIHLGDRPIAVTINRMLRSLSIWDTVRLGWRLLTTDDTITQAEVEECRDKSMLDKCMEDLAKDFPHFDELFVKERDQYMAYSLANAAMPVADENGHPRAVRVVGVVGIGHARGIRENWGKVSSEQVRKIMTIPEPQLSKRILKATLKYGFYGLVVFGAYKVIRPRWPSSWTL